jgi:phospholipase C
MGIPVKISGVTAFLAAPALLLACVACLLAGCGGMRTDSAAAQSFIPGSQTMLAGNPIKHFVIVVQENRSFDNIFKGYPGADSATTGVSRGKTIPLQQATWEMNDISHYYPDAMTDYDGGKLDGFSILSNRNAYVYMKRSLVSTYWTMAKQYALGDHMFSTEWGPSFTAHQMIIAGTTAISPQRSIVDLPGDGGGLHFCGATGPGNTSLLTNTKQYLASQGPYPCFSYPTMATSLDKAHVSWRYYYPAKGGNDLWDPFKAIKAVYSGPDWANIVTSPSQILTDAKAGKLAGVSWVVPDYENSDHPGTHSSTGPEWVAAIVNAIGTGPDWKTTAIVVVWDEWGGLYDHVAPPQKYYFGLGFRVPCLIISPYAKAGYVSHTVYEFASPLKTIEQIFGAPSIGTTDVTANSMLDSFDFTKPPRPFKKIPSKLPPSYFLTQPQSNEPPDDD